jgi:MFS family permease
VLATTVRYIAQARATAPPVFWFVWWGTLINRLGGFVVPLLSLYLTTQRHLSIREAGAVVSMFGLGQIGASLIGGVLADRIGRRPTMMIGLFGGALMMTALAFADTPSEMALFVGLLALVGEMYRPAVSALVADVVAPEHRVAAYGLLYWAVNLGFALASIAGGLLASVDFFLLFLFDAATMAIYGVVIAWKVPETSPRLAARRPWRAAPPPDAPPLAPAVAPERGPLADPVFLLFVVICLFFVLIPHQSGVVLTVHMTSQGFSSTEYGLVIALNGLLIVFLQPWMTVHSARRDPVRVLAVAMLIAGAGMAMHGAATALWMHFLAVFIWTSGEILEAPTRAAAVAAMAPAHARGRYQGALVVAWGGGMFLAPRLGSWIWERQPVALWWSCLGVGVVVALATLAVGPRWRQRMKAPAA